MSAIDCQKYVRFINDDEVSKFIEVCLEFNLNAEKIIFSHSNVYITGSNKNLFMMLLCHPEYSSHPSSYAMAKAFAFLASYK